LPPEREQFQWRIRECLTFIVQFKFEQMLVSHLKPLGNMVHIKRRIVTLRTQVREDTPEIAQKFMAWGGRPDRIRPVA
jgi:hypothetical protein